MSTAKARPQFARRIFGVLAAGGLVTGLCACEPSGATGDPSTAPTPAATQLKPRDEVLIPAGSFDMGSPYGEADEQPVHRAQVASFYLDRNEVTNAEYREFLAAVAKGASFQRPDGCPADKDFTPSFPKRDEYTLNFPADYFTNPKYDSYPVVGVDWFDAACFASWCGRRLPSEVEWEYAARGPENRTFPWGEDSPLRPTPRANYYTPKVSDEPFGRELKRLEKFGSAAVLEHYDGHPFPAPVGSYAEGSSEHGLADLAGNVWEWTSSEYLPYEDSNPQKRAKMLRVVRGGAWDSPSSFLFRAANRVSCEPEVRRFNIGFRTARTAKAQR